MYFYIDMLYNGIYNFVIYIFCQCVCITVYAARMRIESFERLFNGFGANTNFKDEKIVMDESKMNDLIENVLALGEIGTVVKIDKIKALILQIESLKAEQKFNDAIKILENYGFPGNIRQLKNIAEQISVVEENRAISANKLMQYLPSKGTNLPSVIDLKKSSSDFSSEREIMYKILFDMRNDINDLKKLTLDLMKGDNTLKVKEENKHLIQKIYSEKPAELPKDNNVEVVRYNDSFNNNEDYEFAETIDADESLSIQDKEIELIKKSLERNNGKRKLAAKELGISERTLYRKIKQYDL